MVQGLTYGIKINMQMQLPSSDERFCNDSEVTLIMDGVGSILKEGSVSLFNIEYKKCLIFQ